ncbi:MAG: caspase family protein [Fibromonadales bacterium]|nr:caspase family protein [Fibromonadales bacterium]
MNKTLFVFLLVFAALLQAAQQKIERFLLSAGANNGGTDRVLLRYAESDANSFAEVFSQMGGIDKGNILRISNPSVKTMQNGFAEIGKRLQGKKSDTRKEVLVYYSGHADEKGLRLGNEVYSWADFRKSVNNLNADIKIAVLDACGSGAITRTKGGVSRPAFLQDASSEMTGYAYLTSSNENEASQESDRIRGSFFTHALVSGLRGAADMNGDSKVTLSEAYQFAFNETLQNTQSTSGGTQHPSRDMNLAGTGDVVMTDLREMSAGLVLEKNLEGRFFIRDNKGNLVAELYKAGGKTLELGLPAGVYSVQMEAPSRLWKAGDIELKDGKKQVLSMESLTNIDKETAIARGNSDSLMTSLDSARAAPFKFNPFGHSTQPENGVQLGFFTYASRAFVGTQISLLGNIAGGDMAGTQLTPFINAAIKDFYGLQGSALLNYATNFNGVQAGMFNFAVNGKGLQASTINIYAHNLEGAQASVINLGGKVVYGQYGVINAVGKTDIGQGGVINVAGNGGKLQGGVINAAGSTEYGQGGVINVTGNAGLAQGGVINVAGKASILQGGVINVGGHVGRQIGIINISAKSDNTPIGLVNIVGNGIIDATFYADETARTGVALHLGTPYLYSVWEYAIEPSFDGWNNTWPRSFGFGLGTRFGMWGNFLNLDYTFVDVPDKRNSTMGLGSDDANRMQKLRFGASYKLLPGFALSSGITLNALTTSGSEDFWLEPRGEYHWHWKFGEHKVRLWPGLYAGVTVGKF